MTATEVAPTTGAPATETTAPATATATNDSLLAAAAKAANEAPAASPPDYSAIKFEGAKDEFLSDYRAVLAELKADPKVGQALLDKLFPRLIERSTAAAKAAEEAAAKAEADKLKGWKDELAKDAEFAADKTEANSKAAQLAFQHAGKDVFERLQKDGLDTHPAITRLVVNVGRRLLQATGTDTVATGSGGSPAKPQTFEEKAKALFEQERANRSKGRG